MKKIMIGLLVGLMLVSQVQAMGWQGKKRADFDRGKIIQLRCRKGWPRSWGFLQNKKKNL
ncbi:hypothetical protein COT42_07935 [Candidatus Saganbacteria bacterium CG08_land_8_20_14_0_20_45_16]|uniref:Uncharacterized protein n=1 Tax=Candidatus Saganbacteria bacterium CG08_land_8_20_14_0_20_45_16 TaxID=2014293 RepID=A0A2H0XU47_UNCSA|nr:MAG: hypothetical protein COT42_07935 [Candidatus Saganbacteria bacterium CG08_land_8_20_14_0_20_45_16]